MGKHMQHCINIILLALTNIAGATMQNTISKISAYLVVIFSISACGGGGGSDGAVQTPTPVPAPVPAPAPVPTPVPESIIINGGFEDDTADSQPTGSWNVVTDNGKAVIKVIESTEGNNTHTGSKALEVVVNEIGDTAFAIEVVHGPIEVTAGQRYDLSFWVKGDTGKKANFTVGLTEQDSFAQLASEEIETNGDWQEITINFGANATMIRIPVHFSIEGNQGGATFYLDDLALIEGDTPAVDTNYSAVDVPSLKALAPDNLVIGVAVPAGSAGDSVLTSTPRADIVKAHFNQITAENIMKMDSMQPSAGSFMFDDANALVAFAETNDITVHGHALVWHNQMPTWMRNFNGEKADWIEMMETHAETVAAHFHSLGNTVVSWDVVNEAFSDNGSADSQGGYRGITESGSQDSPWYDNIGPEFIELAFRKAREADPDADLYYNDYSIIGGGRKFNAVRAMMVDFVERGVPITGLGFQTHNPLNFPSINDIRATLQSAVDIAPSIKIKITELDVRIQKNGALVLSSSSADQQKQYYKDIVEVYLEVVPPAQRGGISVWGITDSDSWIPDVFPNEDWPLLFFDDFTPKPALQGFADGLAVP
jgi:GH35 family endo-1,4-beta-xylanase